MATFERRGTTSSRPSGLRLFSIVPTEPGWLDMGTQLPGQDTTRARTLLDWAPRHAGDDVVAQFVAAFGRGDGAAGPLLQPAGGRSLDPGGDPSNTPG